MPAESKRRWHADDARALQREDRAWPRYEVVDGELLVTPAPRMAHQYAVGELHLAFGNYLRGNRDVEIWMSPSDVQLEPDTTVQPDLFVAPRVRSRLGWISIRSLALAIEVLSPASLKYDRSIKRRFYQRHRVAEYWIVDIEAQQIERWRPDDERPEIVVGRIEWQAQGTDLPLAIDLDALFAECAEFGGDS